MLRRSLLALFSLLALALCAAQSSLAAHDQAARAGFDYQLLKPATSGRLLFLVAEAIARRAIAS